MKQNGRVILATATVALIAACGEPRVSQPAEDLLFLSSASGVAVVKPGAALPTLKGSDAVPSRDWSTLVRTKSGRGLTRVVALDPSSDAERWARIVDGNLRTKVVSEDGTMAVLSPVREPGYRDGRSVTKLVVASRDSDQTISLEGNFEPEAFSTDGDSLFVIRYLPPTKPTRYQVRRLDLTTENVEGVYTPDAHLQRTMGGTARVQAASRDGRRLYTLYTLRGDDGTDYAFVHVLSLDELWAHCIHLPKWFAASAERSTALTVTPDGSRLYVANAQANSVAEIDTEQLGVSRTAAIGFGMSARTHAAFASDGTLYLASGPRVTAVDTRELTEKRYWLMPENVKGLQVRADAKRLYVALRDRIAPLNAITGDRLETFDPPGIKRISGFGPVQRAEEKSKKETKNIVCAC